MPVQNYEHHAQFVTGFHRILAPLLMLTFIGACVMSGCIAPHCLWCSRSASS